MSTEINIKKRIDIQEEGVSITPDVNSINFTGAGVTASTVGDNVTVNVQGSVGATAYYLNETVTQAPYKEFSSIPTLAAEQTIATVVGAGATAIIQSFQTPSGVPNTTNIPTGLWQFYLHFSGTSGDSWDVYAEVYKRDLGGIETLLLTTDTILTTTLTAIPTMILTDGVFPASTVFTTDRIVVKVKAINTGVAGQTITFHTEGSTNYSVGTTTLNQIVPTGAVTSVTGTAPVVSSGGTTPAISMAQANGSTNGYLDSTDWTTFNSKTPSTRNITINSTTQDLSADRTWNVGTVTSAGITAGTGISLSGTNPITSSGSITVTNSAPDQTVVLNAGTGIGVTGTYPNFTVTNTDTGSAVTLGSAGGTETLVNDGTGPALATKGVTAGTGISLSSTSTALTVTNSAPDQVVALTPSTGINVTGAYPNFTIANTAPDQTVALTAGTGIGVTGTYPNFTIDNTGALSDVNIYNSNGTLTADRTVTMNNQELTFNGGASSIGTQINISSAANRAKGLNFQVGSGLRWKQQVSGAEIGSDNGSQLAMLYYDDAGVLKGTAFSISRTNGAFRLNNAYSLPLSGGTTGQVLTTTTLGLTEFRSLPAEIQAAASDETTNLTIGTAKTTFRMPHAMTLTAVRASLTTAQIAGALLTVDINQNGVSVLGTKLTIDNTEKTSTTAATPATIVTSSLTDDAEITIDIDQVGTALAKGLKITLIGTRA